MAKTTFVSSRSSRGSRLTCKKHQRTFERCLPEALIRDENGLALVGSLKLKHGHGLFRMGCVLGGPGRGQSKLEYHFKIVLCLAYVYNRHVKPAIRRRGHDADEQFLAEVHLFVFVKEGLIFSVFDASPFFEYRLIFNVVDTSSAGIPDTSLFTESGLLLMSDAE